ncbi:MAG: serine/threonine protein kinase [Chloroflexi bacterium]|nr:serine/threonine protein kinase [Chloroflexota bacterium]
MSFNVGENIGPYRVIEQFGQGGMATVFKAYHASLDRYVALKVLHPAFNQDPNFEARFQREARVVAKLEHPNIVPVYDYAEHEKRPYLVMKFIEGITLKARMDQGPLTSEEITKIVDAVGSALAYAHRQGVLHRDIKPSNVLIATDGQVYLADFGLARIAQSGESTLSSDTIMGTPQYISPEQAMGRADLDQRTDLYSFGVMLYEMVVGKVPFNADTPFSIIHDHIYSPMPLPRTVNPNVPEPIERVLLKALAKEREDRFEDAAQLASAFKAAWNEAGVPSQGAGVGISPVVPLGEKAVSAPVLTASNETAPPTKVAGVPETVVRAEEQPGTIESVPGRSPERAELSKTKRSPFILWVGAALVVILCVGGLAVARNRNLFARLLPRQPQVSTAVPGEPVVSPPVEQPDQPRPDAGAYLKRALDAWHANDLKRSMDEVNQLIALSGNQGDFLIEAGAQLYDAGQYIGAAYVYSRAAQIFKEQNGQVPPDVRERFESSFYFAAAMDEFLFYLPLDALRESEPGLALFGQSRYALLHDNMEIARRELDELLRTQPDWYLTRLLNAEVMYGEGAVLEPRRILQDLIQSPRVPGWVKERAEILMSEHQ